MAFGKHKKGQLAPGEIALFCTQIAMMLKAGIPLYDGIAAMHEDMGDSPVKQVTGRVDQLLQDNLPLAQAMEQAHAFPGYVVNMAAIGETSGRLEEVMLAMADYYEREKSIRERLLGAVVYPVMLFMMMSAVVLVLITKVLPMFNQIFRQLGGQVSHSATAAMNFGMVAGGIALSIIAILLVLLVLMAIFSKTAQGKRWLGRTLLVFPFTRNLTAKMAARRFASAMSLMLASGVDTQQAMAMTITIIGNDYIAEKLEACSQQMMDGKPFAEAILQSEAFPGLFSRMIGIGFKTGAISDVMKKLTQIYEEEIDTSLSNLTAVIEPTLVGILAFVIGTVLIAVMLPLAGIMSAIG